MIRQLEEILESALIYRSDLLPSYWAEERRVLSGGESLYEGKFRYDRTPYTRGIIDTLHPSHPAKKIAVMKGGQVGCSKGVIENGIGWIMDQEPGNVLYLTGHSDLSEESMNNIDSMIQGCNLGHLIGPAVAKSKNNRTGDTTKKKEFPDGWLISGSATNHKILRQRSARYGFIDDYEAAPKLTKQSGSTAKMIEQRFAAYYDVMKLMYISTPERKATSNIEPLFLKGDQQLYYIPCPCCGVFIPLKWSVDLPGTKEKAGIVWKANEFNKVDPNSVGYVCQECAGFFTEKNKFQFNLDGRWTPTAVPTDEDYVSFHISSLYAPPGMYDWHYYIRMYLEANPPGQPQKEAEQQTFVNLALGETFEPTSQALKGTMIMKNIRTYAVGSLPEKQSIEDGNGSIVLLTCACDLNGIVEDARLDYEIVAWTESGASYSIRHGSIGTFIPRENTRKVKVDRERWTYEENKPKSVWPELDKILDQEFVTDTGRRMRILVSGVDCGHYTNHAYTFLDKTNNYVLGLRGDKEGKYLPFDRNVKLFKPGQERAGYWLIEVGKYKDALSGQMRLKWDEGNEMQPSGFLNFPEPSEGLYTFTNYFEHFESERRFIETKEDGVTMSACWKKVNSAVQNHMWDCRIYNMALKDIVVHQVGKELKMKEFTWRDYVNIILGRT